MGLLDSVIGALAAGNRGGAGGGAGGGLGGMLGSVLGGGNSAGGGLGGGVQGALLTAVIGMLANGAMGGGANAAPGAQAQGGGGMGGLGDLIGKFSRGGMGDVVGSWVGTGQNAPISGDQLTNVLGSGTIADLAKQLGLSQQETAGQLSEMLPEVVDRLTPTGQAPAGGLGSMADILAQLSKR